MKKKIFIALLLLIGVAFSAYSQITKIQNVAELRTRIGANKALAELQGYDFPNDGGGQTVYWDANSTELDNGGTVFKVNAVNVGRWKSLNVDAVNVKRFGAKGDRDLTKTDDRLAIQNAINSGHNIVFSKAKYFVNGLLNINRSNTEIDLGGSEIYFGGVSTGFIFGSSRDTSSISDVKISNGSIFNDSPNDAVNRLFVVYYSVKNGKIEDLNLNNVSNGGILVTAGSSAINIDNITIDGTSAYSTCRAIWVNGSTASDYKSQLIDISSYTRNTQLLPIYNVKDVTINNVRIKLQNQGYGIYLMNSDNTSITYSKIDIGTSAGRCIAVNNYSPNTKIIGNTLVGNGNATGVLITQFSKNVIVSKNTFLGDFKGGRDIYIQYLAEANISNNIFNTSSNTRIQINSGGCASIKNNDFLAPEFVSGENMIEISTIDEEITGSPEYGNTATLLSDIYIQNNTFRNCNLPITASQYVAQNGNVAGIRTLIVEDNKAFDFDKGSLSNRLLNITSLTSAYKINVVYSRNYAYPFNYSICSGILDANGFSDIKISDFKTASFLVTVPSGGGTISVTSLGDDGLFNLNVSRSANNVLLVPRTNGGSTGAVVAKLLNIVPFSTNMKSYTIADWSASNLTMTAIDHSNNPISLSTVGATFIVYLSYKY